MATLLLNLPWIDEGIVCSFLAKMEKGFDPGRQPGGCSRIPSLSRVIKKLILFWRVGLRAIFSLCSSRPRAVEETSQEEEDFCHHVIRGQQVTFSCFMSYSACCLKAACISLQRHLHLPLPCARPSNTPNHFPYQTKAPAATTKTKTVIIILKTLKQNTLI